MSKAWSDKRVPTPDECVLPRVLEHWAKKQPDATFVRFSDGNAWTYAQTLELSRRCAAGLARLGVRQGDKVISWLPNCAVTLQLWFGLNFLGAVYVPINTSFRGRMLEHVVSNSSARLIVAHAALVERLREIELSELRDVVVVGGDSSPICDLVLHPEGVLSPSSLDGLADVALMPWDAQSIIYTSGTTGPSKGVLSSYMHLYTSCAQFDFLSISDRYLVMLPMFHVGGTIPIFSMLMRGASIALIDGFNANEFWKIVRDTRSTFTTLLGTMASMLRCNAAKEEDRDHTLRHMLIVPLSGQDDVFKTQYGCDLYTLFTMTEVSVPLISKINPRPAESCGKQRAGVELRIVDENDCEVSAGRVGELIIRTDAPWAQNHGYFRNPEATAQAWRNGWFHTGDAFRRDEEGNFFFVDRFKDSIRRRGENISSFEVEAEIAAYSSVSEVAVVGVSAGAGDEEVMAVIVRDPQVEFEHGSFMEFLIKRMPHFMVPRYVRLVDVLPKTSTHKVQKHILRAEGVTADTWDREAAGLVLRRQRLQA